MGLDGRVVAITGGTRGIGRATAAALAKAGARVAIGGTDARRAESVAAELGNGVRGYRVDVTSRPSFAAFLDAVERDLGPLDVLVNNAGIMPVGPFLDETDELAARQVDTNLHGTIFGMKEALPRMLARDRGQIVNVASIIGTGGGFPHIATYCATKHAVVGISEALRMEHLDSGVEFTCVLPGLVNTEMSTGVKAGPGVKIIEPDDVASAIVAAVETPRFRVWVPPVLGPLWKIMALLPQRLRDGLGRKLDADKLMARADRASRAEYERRIAGASSAAPGEERELTAEEQLDRVDAPRV
jgi:NAD(P)-dependent dehydrogenase (short-subunit alcohol dehydrogenase family)